MWLGKENPDVIPVVKRVFRPLIRLPSAAEVLPKQGFADKQFICELPSFSDYTRDLFHEDNLLMVSFSSRKPY